MVTAVEKASEVGVHMAVSFTIMYVATGSIAFGGLAAFLEPVCTVTLMPFHRRLWGKLRDRLERRQPVRASRTTAAPAAA